jgi:hypothetical protein
MNPRVVNTISILLCGALLAVVCLQQRRVAFLRAERQRVLARIETSEATSATTSPAPANAAATTSASPELLRLRNEVAQLAARRKELSAVRTENERLQARVAARATNSAGALPEGFIRASRAEFKGFNAPEDTVQTILWAMQHHDLTNMLQGFSPDLAEKFLSEFKQGDDPWKDAENLIAVRVISQKQMPDGSMELEVESLPGPEAHPEKTRFYLINGQWKIGKPQGE